jgi:hypothetical protein
MRAVELTNVDQMSENNEAQLYSVDELTLPVHYTVRLHKAPNYVPTCFVAHQGLLVSFSALPPSCACAALQVR